MDPSKRKPRQPSMSKAELRAQGAEALAQATKPVMKYRRYGFGQYPPRSRLGVFLNQKSTHESTSIRSGN
jgi:hypothetical protein